SIASSLPTCRATSRPDGHRVASSSSVFAARGLSLTWTRFHALPIRSQKRAPAHKDSASSTPTFRPSYPFASSSSPPPPPPPARPLRPVEPRPLARPVAERFRPRLTAPTQRVALGLREGLPLAPIDRRVRIGRDDVLIAEWEPALDDVGAVLRDRDLGGVRHRG